MQIKCIQTYINNPQKINANEMFSKKRNSEKHALKYVHSFFIQKYGSEKCTKI